ncbi:ATP-binding protein [Leptolyngbya sp. NIES-2104]|uniref:ATP-binding protein n=1 Tax=Leptolyngbya sp. NIES-2104 TaxID=1552121 RepID=UPI0006ECBB7F|nr:ATP-binding protein [Leptolyngbya sp. NIES-2104]GAP96957.1 putative SigmaB associated two-component system sensor protein [Leptolyngbya sp. NIES-2104]
MSNAAEGQSNRLYQMPGRLPILTVEIRYEQDVVLARQRARQIAAQLDFDPQAQTRIATAISEIARNAFIYAGGGKAEFAIVKEPVQSLLIRVSDSGAGIRNLSTILSGHYQSSTGMGLGLLGAKRLMDAVQIESELGRGTIVDLIKHLPNQTTVFTPDQIGQLVDQLLRQNSQDPYTEIQQQNQELISTLEELRQRQEQLTQLNQELEDTNRGVVALYAELNDRAESLQKVSELKTRFLSDLSHEFRTPLNGILNLSNMLLSRLDGDLSEEQEKQVTFIHRSAESLTELVNDLLDLAKVEAGKVEVNLSAFQVADLFGALRGLLRPLLSQHSTVKLVFEDGIDLPILQTDEGKVSQILRNFVSNALKFTEHGEVRVSAAPGADHTIVFIVSDTGIGIALEDQKRIFEEFVQIDNPMQRRFKGTGLGLPLCKRLAELLGGSISVSSRLGAGAQFCLILPIQHQSHLASTMSIASSSNNQDQGFNPLPIPSDPLFQLAPKVLVIDDDAVTRYTIAGMLAQLSCTVVEAKDGYEGLYRAKVEQPNAIVLDLLMPGIDGFEVLSQLKADSTTDTIPVIILTSKQLSARELEQLTAGTPSSRAIAVLSKQPTLQQETDPARKTAIAQLKTALLDAGLSLGIAQ